MTLSLGHLVYLAVFYACLSSLSQGLSICPLSRPTALAWAVLGTERERESQSPGFASFLCVLLLS